MAVKVKRERADQRRHHRVTAPLHVAWGGHRLRAADWSLGGLRVDGFPGELPGTGAEIALQLSLPFQGFDVSFDAKAEVVRADPATGMFAVRFTVLGERERELMQHFIEELVRGSMVNIEDTIQRIDVPVTPASLEPDPNPVAGLPIRRWPVKTLAMIGVYALFGVVVFGYTALLGYTNFYRMEVQTAVITAPTETVAAQADGRIEYAGVKPGDPVKTGQIILNVLDNQLEREIELADIAIREQKAKLIFLKRRQSDEIEKIKGFAAVDTKNLQQFRIDISSLEAQLRLAENHLARLATLHGKGYATDAKLEEAQKQVIALTQALENRKIETAARAELADQNFGKRYYNGNNMVGDLEQFEAQIRLAEHEIAIAHQKHLAMLNQRRSLAVQSPFEGTLLELPRVNLGHVRRGDIIAVIEQRKHRQVTAFLTQDEVLRVGLGDEAQLFVPALQEMLTGRVARIDRTTGFLREQDQRQNPGYGWRGPTDRTAKVTIEFANPLKVESHERYRSGLPVVVIFPQRSTNALTSSIRQKLMQALQ
jgi:multidrug resistance efflux pump